MIDSHLAVLLAERNLRITRVSRDTGISRTTLTALCNDNTGGIKFDTLNMLCNYLKVTPDEFFNYTPYDYEFNVYEDEDSEQTESIQALSGHIERIYGIDFIIKKYDYTWKLPLNALVEALEKPPFEHIRIAILLSTVDTDEPEKSSAYLEWKKMIHELTPRQVERIKENIRSVMEQKVKVFLLKKYNVSAEKIYAGNVTHSYVFNFMD